MRTLVFLLSLAACAKAPVSTGVDARNAEEAPATQAVAIINSVSRTLDRAQFGTTSATSTLYLEVHEGGVAACPETETPKRTMVIDGVPSGAPGTKVDGASVLLWDFTGDQFDDSKPLKATAATITIVKLEPDASVELDVDATFAEGTIKGRVYATYCAAMSE